MESYVLRKNLSNAIDNGNIRWRDFLACFPEDEALSSPAVRSQKTDRSTPGCVMELALALFQYDLSSEADQRISKCLILALVDANMKLIPSDIYTALWKCGVLDEDFLSKLRRVDVDAYIDQSRDLDLTFPALITLYKSYLLRINASTVETPQMLYLRTAVAIHGSSNTIAILTTYDHLSRHRICHASPTLFNAGTRRGQLSSCFVMSFQEDSINGIYEIMKEIAIVSQCGGGIGLDLTLLRSNRELIKSTQRPCKGVFHVLNQLEEEISYVDQGGRRNGAIRVFFELTHPEILEIISCKRHGTNWRTQFKDINIGLWVSDLFMKRVKEGGIWTCFGSKEREKLADVYGADYEELYSDYERRSLGIRTLEAKTVFASIIESLCETGGPSICFKDTANSLSNQSNLGIIRGSNLCVEIYEVSSREETSVCNLACLNLAKCVYLDTDDSYRCDFSAIEKLTSLLVCNLNKVIDENYYLNDKTRRTKLSRPIGIGVAGLQELFHKLMLPMCSVEARKLNRKLFECIYFSALETSCKLSYDSSYSFLKILYDVGFPASLCRRLRFLSGSYKGFEGSPLSRGQTQIELYEELVGRKISRDIPASDWAKLMDKITVFGVRNSLLVALMPTVTTACLMNTTDSFEAPESYVLLKNTLHGMLPLINPELERLLKGKNRFTKDVLDEIVAKGGSVQHLEWLSLEEKNVFKTAFELNPKDYIDLAIDRAPFVDQGQSLSLYIEAPWKVMTKISNLLFYCWENKLKTGIYYLRSKSSFTNDVGDMLRNRVCESCQ